MNEQIMRLAVTACCLFAVGGSGQAAEQVKETFYPISGQTGIELYTSIGENGPNNSGQGAIAHTLYKLKWARLFDERGGDCYLVSARPDLSITYVYPKPKEKLTPDMSRRWSKFIEGIRTHEQQHAVMIREMVKRTQTAIAGAVVTDDPTCSKVKREVSRRIDEATAGHKARSRLFDRVELSEGGPVHRLILALVNQQ